MELLFNQEGMPKIVEVLNRFQASFKRQDIDTYRSSGGTIRQYYEETLSCLRVRFHDDSCQEARIAVFSLDEKGNTWVYEYEDRWD